MKKRIEEMIAEEITKDMKKEMQSALKSEFVSLRIVIKNIISEELKNYFSERAELLDDDLITIKEAREKAKLNPTEFQKLLDTGAVKYKISPKGRKKIIKSSLVAYIRDSDLCKV